MFYSNNNDNYMQDLYFYNQTPNNTYFPNNMQNYNMMQGQNPNMMYNNPNMYQNQMNQNMNNLYPDIYRIINPVVSRVIANSNYQFLNEDALNNMTDTVYNIVEGQIDLNDNVAQSESSSSSQSASSNTSSVSSNGSNRISETTRQSSISQTSSNSKPNRNDNLLKDIIKILILKELLSRPNRNNQNYCPYCNQMQYNQNF